jgi:hypothetical protein
MTEIGQLIGIPVSGTLLLVIMLWSLAWKGLALWKAARVKSKIWFIVILFINTFGILEIIYIFAVKPRGLDNKKQNTEESNP